MPNILGMDGPVTSASRMPTLAPRRESSRARMPVTRDFPTPPLPETTPMTFLITQPSAGPSCWGACACCACCCSAPLLREASNSSRMRSFSCSSINAPISGTVFSPAHVSRNHPFYPRPTSPSELAIGRPLSTRKAPWASRRSSLRFVLWSLEVGVLQQGPRPSQQSSLRQRRVALREGRGPSPCCWLYATSWPCPGWRRRRSWRRWSRGHRCTACR